MNFSVIRDPTHFNSYIKEDVGYGTYSSVVKCTKGDHVVCIKRPSEKSNYILQLLEVAIVNKLHDNPFVIKLESILINDDGCSIVMPYYEHTLNRFLKLNHVKDNTELKLRLAYQLAVGLKQAHDIGVAHGDFKPSNIMVDTTGNDVFTKDGKCVIIDWGGGTGNYCNTNVGVAITSLVEPPENITANRPLTDKTDVWSYGIVLYYIYTGNYLFGEDVLKHMLDTNNYRINKKKITSLIARRELDGKVKITDPLLLDLLDKIFTEIYDRPDMTDVCNHPFFNSVRLLYNCSISKVNKLDKLLINTRTLKLPSCNKEAKNIYKIYVDGYENEIFGTLLHHRPSISIALINYTLVYYSKVNRQLTHEEFKCAVNLCFDKKLLKCNPKDAIEFAINMKFDLFMTDPFDIFMSLNSYRLKYSRDTEVIQMLDGIFGYSLITMYEKGTPMIDMVRSVRDYINMGLTEEAICDKFN